MHAWSKLLTLAAGVLGAVVCYAALTHAANAVNLTDSVGAVTAMDLTSANIGALASALVVALLPADRRHAVLEAFTTWAVATVVLMFMVAPNVTASHHIGILQAAR